LPLVTSELLTMSASNLAISGQPGVNLINISKVTSCKTK